MGRGEIFLERAVAVSFILCGLVVGLAAAAEFRCYDCASLLSPDSPCETGPDYSSSTTCNTYCYTDVLTQAGVRSYMKRGCTTELECTEGSTCRELSRTGSCRSCCQANLCNDESPDALNFTSKWAPENDNNGAAGAMGGLLTRWGRGFDMVGVICFGVIINYLPGF